MVGWITVQCREYSIAGIADYVDMSITNPSGASITVANSTHNRRIVLYYTETYAGFASVLGFGHD